MLDLKRMTMVMIVTMRDDSFLGLCRKWTTISSQRQVDSIEEEQKKKRKKSDLLKSLMIE